MKSEAEKSDKKQYSSPELLIYGNILELTQNVTNTGATNDNPVMKT
jgi:hypothetical protein